MEHADADRGDALGGVGELPLFALRRPAISRDFRQHGLLRARQRGYFGCPGARCGIDPEWADQTESDLASRVLYALCHGPCSDRDRLAKHARWQLGDGEWAAGPVRLTAATVSGQPGAGDAEHDCRGDLAWRRLL